MKRILRTYSLVVFVDLSEGNYVFDSGGAECEGGAGQSGEVVTE